jgi:hypothetical protein
MNLRPVPDKPVRLSQPTGPQPCPARTTAYLGFAQPTTIPCGGVAGHAGQHHYEIRWS